jgi:arginyl-tRNA synthetase
MRIQSIIRKANFDFFQMNQEWWNFTQKRKNCWKQLELFPEVIQNAAQNHSPALLANYGLVREYNFFYQAVPILGSVEGKYRVQLSKKVADTIFF